MLFLIFLITEKGEAPPYPGDNRSTKKVQIRKDVVDPSENGDDATKHMNDEEMEEAKEMELTAFEDEIQKITEWHVTSPTEIWGLNRESFQDKLTNTRPSD